MFATRFPSLVVNFVAGKPDVRALVPSTTFLEPFPPRRYPWPLPMHDTIGRLLPTVRAGGSDKHAEVGEHIGKGQELRSEGNHCQRLKPSFKGMNGAWNKGWSLE